MDEILREVMLWSLEFLLHIEWYEPYHVILDHVRQLAAIGIGKLPNRASTDYLSRSDL